MKISILPRKNNYFYKLAFLLLACFWNSFCISSFSFLLPNWYQKSSQNRPKIDKKSIKKRCATRSPKKAPPRLPKASPKAAPGLPNGSVRRPFYFLFWLQDRSKSLLERSWALFPLPKPFLEPLGHLRGAPGPLQEQFSDPPGPPKDPPETTFRQLQPALKKRLTYIPRYSNL